MSEPILVGKSGIELFLLPEMANRHGLIAGATGTGKTITLQTLAEGFSYTSDNNPHWLTHRELQELISPTESSNSALAQPA